MEGLGDWRVVGDGACAFFATRSFAQSARLVQAIGELAASKATGLNVDLRPDGVSVRLLTATDDWYGMSRRDAELAGQISARARDLGLPTDPSAVQTLLVIPGAPNIAEVMPFWRAILGYQPRP
jgi:4a-hydroxytetrahydrobiopterin dehydratase